MRTISLGRTNNNFNEIEEFNEICIAEFNHKIKAWYSVVDQSYEFQQQIQSMQKMLGKDIPGDSNR